MRPKIAYIIRPTRYKVALDSKKLTCMIKMRKSGVMATSVGPHNCAPQCVIGVFYTLKHTCVKKWPLVPRRLLSFLLRALCPCYIEVVCLPMGIFKKLAAES